MGEFSGFLQKVGFFCFVLAPKKKKHTNLPCANSGSLQPFFFGGGVSCKRPPEKVHVWHAQSPKNTQLQESILDEDLVAWIGLNKDSARAAFPCARLEAPGPAIGANFLTHFFGWEGSPTKNGQEKKLVPEF